MLLKVNHFTMKISIEKFWNISFNLICIAGCAYQIIYIFLSYFEYGTVTRNKYYQQQITPFSDLHTCFLCLSDMLNMSHIQAKYGISEKPHDSFDLMDIVTIGDMLTFTPDIDISECAFRDSTGNYVIFANQSMCSDFFALSKYLNGQYVCHKLSIKDPFDITLLSVSTSLKYDRSMYEIRFVGQHSKARKIRPTITTKIFPTIGNKYASTYYKSSNQDLSLHISCQNITNYWLGYPYDSFTCEEEGEIGYYQCFDSCIEKKTMKEYNRLPYTSFYNTSMYGESDIKMMSPSMIKNRTISSVLNKWYIECGKICNMYACVDTFCLSVGHSDTSIQVNGIKSGSTIRIESPSSPNAYIIYVPQVPLLDFIIYILSSLGTWFGLVIIQCNPIQICKYSNANYCNVNVNYSRHKLIERLRRRSRANRVDMFLHRMNRTSQLDANYYSRIFLHRNRILCRNRIVL